MTDPQLPPHRPSDQVVSTASGDETILLDLRSEKYFALNELGGRIWQCLTDQGSLDQLVIDIASEYDEPAETVQVDTKEVLDYLTENGLVESVS